MARSAQRPPASNPTEELIQLAIDLDVTALAQNLPTLLENAENHSPSFTEFSLQMFRTEANARTARRVERSLKRSRLGAVEGLEGFDIAARPKLDPRVVRELLGCRFVAEHRNVLCLGPAGLEVGQDARYLMQLAQRYGAAGLEAACQRAIYYRRHHNQALIGWILEKALDRFPLSPCTDLRGQFTFSLKQLNSEGRDNVESGIPRENVSELSGA